MSGWLEIDCPACGIDYDYDLPLPPPPLVCPCGHVHSAAELAAANVYDQAGALIANPYRS